MWRSALAVTIGLLVAVVFVGVLGQVPHWGEIAPASFAAALLGLWAVTGAAFGRRA